jgi:hypothetical protein
VIYRLRDPVTTEDQKLCVNFEFDRLEDAPLYVDTLGHEWVAGKWFRSESPSRETFVVNEESDYPFGEPLNLPARSSQQNNHLDSISDIIERKQKMFSTAFKNQKEKSAVIKFCSEMSNKTSKKSITMITDGLIYLHRLAHGIYLAIKHPDDSRSSPQSSS